MMLYVGETISPTDLLIGGGLLFLAVLYRVWRANTRRRGDPVPGPRPPGLDDRALLTPPVPFGYKTAWFAIRSTDMQGVAAALRLVDPQPAGWQYGIWHSVETRDYQIFVMPPIHGWILAAGLPILWEADDHATERMVKLSEKFGEVQFFGSMRVSGVAIWARARNGQLLRRFYEGDGNRQEFGEQMAEEKALGFKFFDSSSPESKDPEYWKRKDLTYPGEDTVLQVAAVWSVDPSRLDQMGLPQEAGLLGGVGEGWEPKPNFP
jgi:hypothetical protein